jgi:hypothetical protein
MLKGPKAALAAAIATALDAFFVIDKQDIQSNLLVNARIALKDLVLRQRPTQLANCSTVATVTGSVDSVVFSWNWGVGASWVQDAKLTIEGMNVHVQLKEIDTGADDGVETNTAWSKDSLEQVVSERVDVEDARKTGGVFNYMKRQVQMVLDSLTLSISDFKFTIHMPPMDEYDDNAVVVTLGGKQLDLVSIDRITLKDSADILKQTLRVTAFSCSTTIGDNTFPILESFDYAANVVRTGERFSDISCGLDVSGDSGNDLIVHCGALQIRVLSQLGVLLTAPPGANGTKSGHDVLPDTCTATRVDAKSDSSGKPSSMLFRFSSLSLVRDDSTLKVPTVEIKYVMDGTAMMLTAAGVSVAGEVQVSATGIQCSLAEPSTTHFDIIETVVIPGIATLSKPITDVTVIKEGRTISMGIKTIDVIHSKVVDSVEDDRSSETADSENQPAISPLAMVPFALSFSFDEISLEEEGNDSSTTIQSLRLFSNPQTSKTDFAVELGYFKNKLLCVEDVCCAGSIPVQKPTTIEDLKLDVETASVAAGYSTQDWAAAFRRTPAKKGAAIWHLPFAKVGPMKLDVSVKGAIYVKDTKVYALRFNGNAATTSDDLINFYAKACLARVSSFVTNAEVFGFNIFDTTFGIMMNLCIPCGGVAAVGAVDSVKGAISAGKKSRNADEGENAGAFDVFRGLIYSTQAAAKSGAARRGKEGGANAIDFVIGAGADTGRYLNKNKSRFGAAGVGSAGMIVGAMFGGPVGAVVGGLVTQKVAGHGFDKAGEYTKSRHSSASAIESSEQLE